MASPNPKLSRELQRAIPKAMRNLAIYLDARFTEEISAVKWEYPTPPRGTGHCGHGPLTS